MISPYVLGLVAGISAIEDSIVNNPISKGSVYLTKKIYDIYDTNVVNATLAAFLLWRDHNVPTMLCQPQFMLTVNAFIISLVPLIKKVEKKIIEKKVEEEKEKTGSLYKNLSYFFVHPQPEFRDKVAESVLKVNGFISKKIVMAYLLSGVNDFIYATAWDMMWQRKLYGLMEAAGLCATASLATSEFYVARSYCQDYPAIQDALNTHGWTHITNLVIGYLSAPAVCTDGTYFHYNWDYKCMNISYALGIPASLALGIFAGIPLYVSSPELFSSAYEKMRSCLSKIRELNR